MAERMTLANFMAEVRGYLPKLDDETPEEYRQRLHDIAHPLFTKHMDEQQAKWHAEQARRERWELMLEARARAALRPIQNVSVHQELNSSRQTKLNRSKEKYTRD